MNIFIVGHLDGAYRNGLIAEFLLNRKNQIYINGLRISKKDVLPIKLIKKVLRKISLLIGFLLSDIIYVSIMSHDTIFIRLAHMFKKKIITEFYISLYDTLVNDRFQIKDGSRRAKRLISIDRNAILLSDKVIFLNESEAVYYCKILNIDICMIPYEIVPLCVSRREQLKLPYFSDKKRIFNICWWGNYVPLHGVEKIIKTIRILKDQEYRIHLHLMCDSIDTVNKYKDLIISQGVLNEITLYSNMLFSNRKLGKFLEDNCDLVMGTFGDSKKAQTVIANKIIDGIAMHGLVMTGYTEGLYEYFTGTDDILMVKNEPEDMAKKIVEIMGYTKDDINTYIKKSYGIYEEKFSYSIYEKKMDKIFNSLSCN